MGEAFKIGVVTLTMCAVTKVGGRESDKWLIGVAGASGAAMVVVKSVNQFWTALNNIPAWSFAGKFVKFVLDEGV